MATVSTSNFGELIKPGLMQMFQQEFGPGGVVKITDNPTFSGYDVVYKHKEYVKSIKISRELMEDSMAMEDYPTDDYYQRELYQQQKQRIDKLEEQQQQQAQRQMAGQQHSHQVTAGSALSGFTTTAAGSWDSATVTGTADGTLAVDSSGSLQLDQGWINDSVDKRVEELNKRDTPKRKANRLEKWFRCNEEMPKNYGLDYVEEPLDDLRQEMAAWLEDV